MGYTTHKGKLAIYNDSQGDYIRDNGIRYPVEFRPYGNDKVFVQYTRKDGKKAIFREGEYTDGIIKDPYLKQSKRKKSTTKVKRKLKARRTSSKSIDTSNPLQYTVQRGDTLGAIAKAYNMPLADLISNNPQIANPNRINVGQKINIGDNLNPSPEDVYVGDNWTVLDPETDFYPKQQENDNPFPESRPTRTELTPGQLDDFDTYSEAFFGKKGWEDVRADKHKYNNWKQQFNAQRDMFRGDTNGYYQFRQSSLDNAFQRRNAVPLIEPRSSQIYLQGTKVGSSQMYNNYLAQDNPLKYYDY